MRTDGDSSRQLWEELWKRVLFLVVWKDRQPYARSALAQLPTLTTPAPGCRTRRAVPFPCSMWSREATGRCARFMAGSATMPRGRGYRERWWGFPLRASRPACAHAPRLPDTRDAGPSGAARARRRRPRPHPAVAPGFGQRYSLMNEAACGGRRFAFQELAPIEW